MQQLKDCAKLAMMLTVWDLISNYIFYFCNQSFEGLKMKWHNNPLISKILRGRIKSFEGLKMNDIYTILISKILSGGIEVLLFYHFKQRREKEVYVIQSQNKVWKSVS